jgi:hypothetical protein
MYIRMMRLEWAGHVIRMEDYVIPKKKLGETQRKKVTRKTAQ